MAQRFWPIVQPYWLNGIFNANIRQFFDCFKGPDDLMDFAEWRKKVSQRTYVPIQGHSVGNSKVVFVVLTIDPATAPIREALKDQTCIFVYGKDPFFNESHWFNRGIEEALDIGAKWIIVMSDDLYPVTPIDKLTELLDYADAEVVWVDPWPDYYHSYDAYLARKHPLEAWMGQGHRKLDELYRKFKVDTVIAPKNPIRKPLHYWAFNKVFRRPYVGPEFRMTSDFAILSAEWCRKQGPEVLNETFNGWEDMDLSMRLRNAKSEMIDFRIGSQIGGQIRPGMQKALKELFNLTIFNQLLREGHYEE